MATQSNPLNKKSVRDFVAFITEIKAFAATDITKVDIRGGVEKMAELFDLQKVGGSFDFFDDKIIHSDNPSMFPYFAVDGVYDNDRMRIYYTSTHAYLTTAAYLLESGLGFYDMAKFYGYEGHKLAS